MYESHVTFANDNLSVDNIQALREKLSEHNIKLLIFDNGYPKVSTHTMTSRACASMAEVSRVVGIIEVIAESLGLRVVRNKLERQPIADDILREGEYFEAHIDFVPGSAMCLSYIAGVLSVSQQVGKSHEGEEVWVATLRSSKVGTTFTEFVEAMVKASGEVRRFGGKAIGKIHAEIAVMDNNVELDYDWVK